MTDLAVNERLHPMVEETANRRYAEGRAEGRREGVRAELLDPLAAYVEKQWSPDIADDFRVQLADPARDLPTLTDLIERWECGETPWKMSTAPPKCPEAAAGSGPVAPVSDAAIALSYRRLRAVDWENITTLEELEEADNLFSEHFRLIGERATINVERATRKWYEKGRADGRREGARAGRLDTLAEYVEHEWGPDIADDFRIQLADPARDLPTQTDGRKAGDPPTLRGSVSES